MEIIIETILKEATKAYKNDEIPVGCAIVKDGKIISSAHNTKQKSHICINHAEILAIIKAEKKTKDWRLDDCELYVTLEPCDMCMEVIRQARIKKVNYLLESKFVNEKNKVIDKKKIAGYEDEKQLYQTKLTTFFTSKR
ncbi:MAG: nucleoside deaminase [Firmicutes bacterium]|nr:nucleoside deaminase [Bacillota bacterium]